MKSDILLHLTNLYTDKSRHYHTLKHICHMLSNSPIALTIEQTLAIWFHDAIYNPMSTTNEEDSAQLVTKLYNVDDLERYANIDKIKAIIMSTKKHEPLCEDAKLVLDLDLAILGANSDIYLDYVDKVKAEYTQHIPVHIFNKGRADFLSKFLQREALFFTEWGLNNFEMSARANLKNELAQLKF